MFEPDSTDWNIIFRALADERRRAIVQYLFTHGDEVPVSKLAHHLAGRAGDNEPEDAAIDSYVAYLHHSLLPALNDANLIDWRSDEHTVTLTGLAYRLPVGTLSPESVPFETAATQQRADD